MSWPPLTRDQDRRLERMCKQGITAEQAARRLKLPFDQVEYLMVEIEHIAELAREKRRRAEFVKSDSAFLAAFQQRRQSRSQEESPAP
jgi:hypothetical protein